MTAPVQTDALSLTLPAKSRSKARRRKWKRPPPSFWWFLLWCVWCVVWTVLDWLHGWPLWALLQLSGVVVYWLAAMRAKEGRPTFNFLPWVGGYLGLFLLLVLTGWK